MTRISTITNLYYSRMKSNEIKIFNFWIKIERLYKLVIKWLSETKKGVSEGQVDTATGPVNQ